MLRLSYSLLDVQSPTCSTGMIVCHEQDPEMRTEPISPEQREDVIAYMAAGLLVYAGRE